MAKSRSIDDLRDEYNQLFARMVPRLERARDISTQGNRILLATNRAHYHSVAAATGVPWFVIGIVHALEASLRFDRHLHNGDPLSAPTRHVPKGRPPGWTPGPEQGANWVTSAIDAIRFDELEKQMEWTVAGIAFALERFNGFGYRNNFPHVKSPYLWSFSNIYTAGKYTDDGEFDDATVSGQCGGMVLLRFLMTAMQP